MNHNGKIAAAVGLAAVIAVIGYAALRRPGSTAAVRGNSVAAAPLYWYDPMRPGQHFDKPGKSPFMDMQLVPKFAGVQATAPGVIAVDSRMVQNLGIRLAKVAQARFTLNVDAVGLVGVDEHRIQAVQVRKAGWVERLDVRAAGDSVHRGQMLAGVYSPDLLATQQELLLARGADDPALIDAARQRLMLFGLSAAQIARIEKSGKAERTVDYYAPFDGYVMELTARQGAAIEPGATLFQLVDLTTVWIMVEVPEAQAAWVKPGDPADIDVPGLPGKHYSGRIDYLYPEFAQATRTLRARVVVQNTGELLRPGMFASAHLMGATRSAVLTVPTEAIIRTGTRSVVIVADDDTHFRPTLVHVGAEQGGRAEIRDGLTLGQNVVASGQFLIDSEASLRSAFDNIAGSTGSPDQNAVHDMMPVPSTQPNSGER